MESDETLLAADKIDEFSGGVMPRSKELLRELENLIKVRVQALN